MFATVKLYGWSLLLLVNWNYHVWEECQLGSYPGLERCNFTVIIAVEHCLQVVMRHTCVGQSNRLQNNILNIINRQTTNS